MRKAVGALLLVVSGVASPAPGDAVQPAGRSVDDLLRLSQQTLRQIDENRGPQLWKASAPFIRTSFAQADYVNAIFELRQKFGTVRERNWINISRVRQAEGTPNLPAGHYANVDFSTQAASGNVLYERVSFKLEADGWRPVGYNAADK